MRCSKCGRDNRTGRKFCAHCAAKLAILCASCGAENEPGELFCGECAKALPEPAQPRPPPDPLSYTPKHLAEKILSSRSALEGERKQVTVLFADLKGSMDLGEKVDPEEWYRIMDRFFQILAEGVHRFEGTVNEYRGDGIMALFGAPIAHEDHAQRACYSALHLREALRRYADELGIGKGINFAVRMGLNSGEVVVGKIGAAKYQPRGGGGRRRRRLPSRAPRRSRIRPMVRIDATSRRIRVTTPGSGMGL